MSCFNYEITNQMFARTVSADSTQQCAGHCQTNATYCNVFVFDDIKNICNLGTMGGSYNIISGQGDSFSHIDIGTVWQLFKVIFNRQHFIIFTPN